VLAISIGLEIVTGMVLTLRYIPDAGQAYQITAKLLDEGGWSVLLNFHYYTAYLIFALILVHMMRVFFSGGYRGAKIGLWQIGVALAGTVFLLSITGEALHWDERGFGVPWHTSEIRRPSGWTRRSLHP
jgi:quinol-cytochrome oxidoreductase complex cytochrome b subunit